MFGLKILSRCLIGGLSLALLTPLIAGRADAQQAWPRRPVRFIVPFAPGAGADIGARLAADVLSRKWGQPVVVENRPGGDSLIAIRTVVNDNDDHEFLFAPAGNFTPHPYLHDKLGYVRARDLLPIARFSNTILAVSATNKLPSVKTLKDLVDEARKRPGQLNVVTVPGITEFVWDGFTKSLNLQFTKVPFTNLVQGASEMATGRIDVTMAAYAIMQPVVQAGGAHVLAVTSHDRAPALKDVPTALESGVPSLELDGLVGLFGPKSVTPELRKKIGDDVAAVAAMPDIAAKLIASGQTPNPGDAAAFEKAIVQQEEQVTAIAKLTGVKRRAP